MDKIKFDVVDPDGHVSPYIHLDDPNDDLKTLREPNVRVIAEEEVILVIDYPLDSPVEFMLKEPGGWTRRRLAERISETYRMVYRMEDEGASSPPTVGRTGPIFNRDLSDGPFGIWGHVLDDLDLYEVTVWRTSDGVPVLELGVDS